MTHTSRRIAQSVLAGDNGITSLADFHQWFADCAESNFMRVHRQPLAELAGWEHDSGVIRHVSGGFFSLAGLDVLVRDHPVGQWSQPIIRQPEVGILGILVKEFDGVLHCLMQAKVEPGNANGLQLSPTVQATRSNYTGVHGGKRVPYLDYFRDTSRHRLMADVLQSEQGSAFYQKRNRNMVVETTEDVEVLEGFRWLTLGQVHRLLALDDIVNMDTRTVLSCLPFADISSDLAFGSGFSDFRSALLRSCDGSSESVHPLREILSWVTDVRSRIDVRTTLMSLDQVKDWKVTPEKITHSAGRFFDVIGVTVQAGGREVGRWMQPMIEFQGVGVVAFLARRINGVLHVLVHARVEPGYLDTVELAPTVQCTPDNYSYLPAEARPPFLDDVVNAKPGSIRYEAILSEEGGRFYQGRNRYLIAEVAEDAVPDHPDYRWMTLHQLVELLQHSNYLNVQARSLVACLHSLTGDTAPAVTVS